MERLREHLSMSQAALAKRLNVSPMAPSRWERGINEPPAEIYIELGKMAGDPGCWYFWERAGLHKKDLLTILPKVESPSRKLDVTLAAAPRSPIATALIPVPVYDVHPPIGQAGKARILKQHALEYVVAPRDWCPHPGRTVAIKMAGDRMAPMIPAGSIVAIDQTEHDFAKLAGKVVLARHPDKGMVLAWVQSQGASLILVPENREHRPDYVHKNDWTACGRVLWWLTRAPV
jgi:SOS-response transcriptional repressor LexA